MKKALRLILMYFWFLAICIVSGTFFYALYLNSLHMVAGRQTIFLSIPVLIKAFFTTLEVTYLIIGALMIAYKIRHPSQAGWQLGGFVLMQLIMWALLFPLTINLEKNYYTTHKDPTNSDWIMQEDDNILLSKGYFRSTGSNIYYFVDDLKPSYAEDEEGSTTIRIDTSNTGGLRIQDVKIPQNLDIITNARPYRDILLHDTFFTPDSIRISIFGNLLSQAKINLNLGWSFFLGFMSLGFALSCLFGLSGLSSWKLMNFTITIVITAAILCLNSFYYSDAWESFRNLNFLNNGFFMFLGKYTTAPFLVFSNVIFGFLQIIAGSVTAIVRKAKRGK